MKRQQKVFLFSFLSILFLGSFLFLSFALAQADPLGLQQVDSTIGLGVQDIRLTIAKIIRAILGLLGIIAISIMLYGGFVYMTAGGNEEKIGTAKKILINGTIGLMIILSSFSIAQFIINQLGKATGAIPGDVPLSCLDDEYAFDPDHKCECYPDLCINNPGCIGGGLDEGDDFILKSLSPVTTNTGMNNVVIRAIFNKSVADGENGFAPDEILDIKYKTQSVSSSFSFEFYPGTNRQLLQAVSIDEDFCTEEEIGEDTSCLDFGNYQVEVRGDLKSAEGYVITEENDCGVFPLDAEFYVGENDEAEKLSYLEFDGVDGRVFISGTSTADFSDEFSLSFWIYIDEQIGDWGSRNIIDNFTGGNPGAGYLIYYEKDNDKLRFSVRRDNPTLYDEDEKTDQKSVVHNVEKNKWMHVSTVFAVDRMSMYVDGELVENLDLPDNYPLYKYGGSLVFGGAQSLANDEYSFKGKLDEVRIYEKVLSDDEIFELAQSRESSNYDGLYAGYHFEGGDGIFVGDFFDGEYNGEISGGVAWVSPEWGLKTSDKIAPEFYNFGLLDVEDDEYLKTGKVYWVSTEITDDSGLGAYHIEIDKQIIGDENSVSESYFDGPRKLAGSDIPIGDPFVFTYPIVDEFDVSYPIFTSHNPEKTTHYTLTLDAVDIDSNFSQVTSTYSVLPEQCTNGQWDEDEAVGEIDCGGPCPACQGDSCTEDWQCASGNKCVNNICTAWPKIVEVDPMHGATGNWVSILGYNFGNVEGQVKFAIDQDGDGEVLGAEWADAFPVNIVNDPDCGDTWRDNYIIIEVPDDEALPQGTKSAIRVSINNHDEIGDATNDGYGKKLGLFEKDNEKLPGLCSVKTFTGDPTIEGATSAEPGTALEIVGNSLGVAGDKKVLYFDDFDVAYDDWTTPTRIFADVPNINLIGDSSVSVEVNDKKSNSIKFEILSDGLDPTPNIEKIDPIDPTAGSYITIFGSSFGDVRGHVYFSTSTIEVEKCVKAESVDVGECGELNLIDFPVVCGNTWKNEQIIAKLPLDTLPGDYFLALRTEAGYFTPGVGVDGIAGEQPLEVVAGEPNPGICKIDPISGVAPRLGDTNTIKIYGDNFTSPNDNPQVYFWINNASTTDPNTWMNTGENVYPIDSVKSITKQEIETEIPYIDKAGSEEDGSSMQSGPIKVGVDGRFSNGVKYKVSDCREASEAEVGLMQSGYQCCEAEGPDQGKWKSNEFACIGETRDAGYVWRFSTGQINARPRVLEQCDEKNWNNKSFDGQYPSPTPSTLWDSTGEEACVNSTVAVKFNIPMDSTTISSSTVKMYSCGSGDNPVCSSDNLLDNNQFYPVLTGENVLEIRSIPPDADLATSTWYHIELSEGILSVAKPDNLGQLSSQVYNLQVTSDCVDDDEVDHCIGFGDVETAYYFEFKTGNFDCQMTNAEVEPKTYTTHYLGKLYSPDGVPPNPLYYFVWGFSDKECIVLSADQYAWDWKVSENNILDINVAPKEGMPTSTSRVSLDALNEHSGVKVEATTGIIEEGEGYEKYTNNILEDIGKPAGLVVTSTDSVFVDDDFAPADFVNFKNYEIDLKYTLNEIGISDMFFIPAQFLAHYRVDRYLFDDDINYIFIRDKVSLNGENKTRELVSNLWNSGPKFIHTYNEDSLLEWSRGNYRIVNNEDGFEVFDLFTENPYEPIHSEPQKQSSEDYNVAINLGAPRMLDNDFKSILNGSIDEFIIERENPVENIEAVITATNTTTIEVYPPVVIDYAPNCAEACVNSSFWVQFSRPMAQITYDGNMELYECETENCINTSTINITKSDTSDNLIFSANLNNGLLDANTWYQAVVKGGNDGVRAIGSIAEGVLGKAMEKDFIWKFRTKNDPSPCAVDSVRINPDPFVVQVIGEQTKYSAIPRSQPDQCSSRGQELNPWSYGWSWDTGDYDVATVTEFTFGTQMSPYCNLGCVLAGSTIPTFTDHAYLCGNGIVDPGEDCDIADEDEIIGTSCTLECLRPGNSLSGVDGEDNTCGNGEVETSVGEECDPGGDKTEWQYCTQNCLNTGSLQEFTGDIETPWCGSATVTDSEDCDLDLSVEDIAKMGGPKNEASAGCSESCLHLGTPLEQAWCDGNPDYADECVEAISWCGNGIIESGEECETINNSLFVLGDIEISLNATESPADYCTNKCLLKNICELTNIPEKNATNDDGLRCDPDTDGCNTDCTLSGSSVSYVDASLCGDGKVGVGEFSSCETGVANIDDDTIVVGNPVQRVYAVGLGEVDPETLKQYTSIEATVESYFNIENGQSVANKLEDNAKVTGFGDYYIACGYEEYITPQGTAADPVYNQCPFQTDQDKKTFGVADNTCCYERSYRIDSYPADGAGFTTAEQAVCPNTLIEFDFNYAIDKNSIEDNFIIATGYTEASYNCVENGMKDVTSLIESTVTTIAKAGDSGGFFQRIWNFVKRFFAGVFGTQAKATQQNIDDVKVWCAGNIEATPEVLNHVDANGNILSSTVELYLDTMLPVDSYIAVYLKGGNQGITDVRGVGIKNNPEESVSMLQDSIVFMTDSEICKIDSVEIDPEQHLFSKPFTSYEFKAITKTKTGQSIVKIPGQYDWDLEWQPQNNEIVNIPAEGFSATTPITTFSVNNLQGSLIAVANAKIIEDKDTEGGSHEGLVFTGITDIEVNFCENPWPERDVQDNWQPFKDGVYNFSFSYCADAGLSDNTEDDLPYLKDPLEVGKEFSVEVNKCNITGELCVNDSDCNEKYYLPLLNIISGEDLRIITGKDEVSGLCWVNDEPYVDEFDEDSIVPKYIACNNNIDCENAKEQPSYCKELMPFKNVCVSVGSNVFEEKTITQDTLFRYIFFNNKNDDAFGIQIFKNSPNPSEFAAKSISDWYAERFDNLSSMQTIELAGYQGLTDGRNYYINALNETPTGEIYSNVYLFSVNKDAQQNTLQMFEKILNSIEFNINITDHGYCLMADTEGLPGNDVNHPLTSVDCTTDFDCRDFYGSAILGTNGVCSNAKTKMFRDLDRLPKIGELQNKIISLDFPELKSGTFLPGYTVSRWPTSWSTFGIQDEINAWVGCNIDDEGVVNDDIDSYTCWNAVSSTYHCPTFSSVYEYEFFDKDDKYYMLHGPLEYFDLDSSMVGYFIDTNYFTTKPWCLSEPFDDPIVFSPFGQKCGDGIVNPGEECDPPGKTVVSNYGLTVEGQSPGSCVGGFGDFKQDEECLSNFDCGIERDIYTGEKVQTEMGKGVCVLGDDLIYDPARFDSTRPDQFVGFSCKKSKDIEASGYACDNSRTYDSKLGDTIKIADLEYVYNEDSEDYIDSSVDEISLFSNKDLRCVYEDDYNSLEQNYFINNDPFTLSKSASYCVGVEDVLLPDYCLGEYEKAYNWCNEDCEWEYTTCQSITKCGNGLVEGDEKCDDGALNGTYGHCADENSVDQNGDLIGACQGLHGQFCGNNEIDEDENGSKLEFCDFSTEMGICEGSDPKECTSDEQCVEKVQKTFDTCFQGTCVMSFDPCENNIDCGFNIIDVPHQCIMPTNGAYSTDKEYSCSWDCQSYGPYCGDGYMQTDYEECDDGNEENQDGCNNSCQKENLACLQAGVEVSDELFNERWVFIAFNEEGKGEPKLECFENTNGNEICRAGNSICKSVAKLAPNDLNLNELSCSDDLTEFYDVVNPDSTYFIICEDPFTNPFETTEAEEKTEEICGNGIIETYTDEDTGEEVIEVCDLGAENGEKCLPEYSNSCTYCSYDCQEILTVDSDAYCGNGEIDFIGIVDGKSQYEACEDYDGQIKSYGGVENGGIVSIDENCNDKGEYLCENQCMDLVNNCVDCGLAEEGATPRIKILNVVTGSSDTIGWPTADNTTYLKLVYGDGEGVFQDKLLDHLVISKNTSNDWSADLNINTDLACNESPGASYYLQINKNQNNHDVDEDRMFDFPVKNESNEVVNEYAISPPVPENTFRVVIRWTDEDKDVHFSGTVFNEGFGLEGGNSQIKYDDVKNTSNPFGGLCNNVDYSGPGKCDDYNGVYVHERGNIEHTYVQSFTIDTDKRGVNTYNYAFAVEQTSDSGADNYAGLSPIVPYKNSKVWVDVYEYMEGQEDTSLYKPIHSFQISDAINSDYSGAKYWHVFNLEYNTEIGKYEVVEVQKIKSNEDQIKQSILNVVGEVPIPDGYSPLATFDLDINDFFYTGNAPQQMLATDFAFILDVPMDLLNNWGGNSKNFELKVVKGVSLVVFSDCLIGSDADDCYQTFVSSELESLQAYIMSDDEENMCPVCAEQEPCQNVQRVNFVRLTEGVPYHFIFRYTGSSDAGIPIKDNLTDGDYSSECGETIDPYSIKANFGFSDQGNFVLGGGTGDMFKLNFEDYSDLDPFGQPLPDIEWYIMSVVRQGDNIFIDMKDKFLFDHALLNDYGYDGFNHYKDL